MVGILLSSLLSVAHCSSTTPLLVNFFVITRPSYQGLVELWIITISRIALWIITIYM